MSETASTFGKIIGPEQQRDAVHVAVAPVTAGENLRPGQHVGFVGEDIETVWAIADGPRGIQNKKAIGIIDPFLTVQVRKGDRIWLFLYPGTITSLRHDWTHPAFVGVASAMTVSESWLRVYADKAGVSYGALLDAARDKNHGGDGYRLPTDLPDGIFDDLDAMWRHYEVVTGDTVTDRSDAPFWCAC